MNTVFITALVILAVGYILLAIFMYNHTQNNKRRLYDAEIDIQINKQNIENLFENHFPDTSKKV